MNHLHFAYSSFWIQYGVVIHNWEAPRDYRLLQNAELRVVNILKPNGDN